MKKAKQSGTGQFYTLYTLPNHVWLPADWVKPGSEYSKSEHVVRHTDFAVLVRESTWSAAKEEPRINFSKEFYGENRPNETWKLFDLWLYAHHAIQILAQKAKDGSADAALKLAALAGEATELLTQVSKAKPELVQRLARIRRVWPVIKKKNAALSPDEKHLFTAIQLGEDDFIELDAQSAKWRMDDAGIIAYGLLTYVLDARADSHLAIYGEVGMLAKKRLVKDFNDASAPDWWEFAKDVLLASYPDPTAIEELNQLVKAEGNRKPKSRFKQAILDVLKSRFLSFAPNRSYQT
jgi:hypothetical protein